MDSAHRAEVYPIQPLEFEKTSEAALPSSDDDSLRTLPKSLRALKDSRHSKSHERTLVICLDGTGDQFDNDNSNVVHFVSCLKKHSPEKQMTYYQSGIGTYDKGGMTNGFKAGLDMAVGSGLGTHIKDAYRFLMQNYHEGDKICLFGFSRGAYTVRCLAGMLHKVGLLPASNGAQVNFAYDFYKDDSTEGWKMSAEFKKTFCTDVNVWFLGLWDCVASVGFFPRKLPFSKSATNTVGYFRHAMALDEHRAKFKVCQWQHQNPDLKRSNTVDETPKAQVQRGLQKTGLFSIPGSRKAKKEKAKAQVKPGQPDERSIPNATSHSGEARPRSVDGSEDAKSDKSHHLDDIMERNQREQDKLEADFNAIDSRRRRHRECETDALEVWFMGAHADVGGGAVANEERHMLSRIPLRWMIRQCFDCDTGILFDTACLADQGLDVHTLWPAYRKPSIPAVGPSATLQQKYESKSLPILQRRSALFKIDRGHRGEEGEEDDDEEEDLAEFRQRHRDAVLPESCEDHFDALARVNDQLTDAKGWWILEAWPVKIRVINKQKDGWEKRVRFNMGRYRAVRETNPNLHWTVQRMVDEGRYKVKCRAIDQTAWQHVA